MTTVDKILLDLFERFKGNVNQLAHAPFDPTLPMGNANAARFDALVGEQQPLIEKLIPLASEEIRLKVMSEFYGHGMRKRHAGQARAKADLRRTAEVAAKQSNFQDALAVAIDPDAYDAPTSDAPMIERRFEAARRIGSVLAAIHDRYEVSEIGSRSAEIRAQAIGRWYIIDSYMRPLPKGMKCLSFNPTVLGRFIVAVLKHKGSIGTIWALRPDMPNSHVSATIQIPDRQIEAFKAETMLELEDPPRVTLSGQSGIAFS